MKEAERERENERKKKKVIVAIISNFTFCTLVTISLKVFTRVCHGVVPTK